MSERVKEVIRLYEKHINRGLAKLLKFAGVEAAEHRAFGMYVVDEEGNYYLDCLGGFGALNFGHRHPKIVEAVIRQLNLMPLSSRMLFNGVQAELAKMLSELLPGDLQYCFFCHSGAEAVEACIKLSRLSTGRRKIVAAQNSYHGKTLGALSASGRGIYRHPFEPLLQWFVHVPFGDVEALEREVDEDTAAVILEPIQGEGGVIIPPDDYLPAAREICSKHGALLILDEVQTGFGRTGANFAMEHYGVIPDLVALAKSLGGGVMPIGAAVGNERSFSSLFENPLIHSSTLGGNPLACAAACAAIEVLQEEKLSERAKASGDYFLSSLQRVADEHSELIKEVRGKGLLIGVEFYDADVATIIVAGMFRRHVLVAYTLNNPFVVRFEPPLIIERKQIDEVVSSFAGALMDAKKLISQLA
ncbi:MAG: aminotransferase class III-fold pyridoxal phosphate-dependent enzyme [Armatimonadota bacterium]|nr:aminotransferase class III-fold pyridoxal phosphate-dependent enzyme [Armatimonadota bacterium]MCX7776799.1 aminotransferase class III-fold pyridoxal phosphate-dependent enzyme [Armatimonadota bacterium]MDW8024595.1 aminotransferase class III-fold pyridoxal phosphate-dependent enzyme [Armatimonadota bacterium]